MVIWTWLSLLWCSVPTSGHWTHPRMTSSSLPKFSQLTTVSPSTTKRSILVESSPGYGTIPRTNCGRTISIRSIYWWPARIKWPYSCSITRTIPWVCRSWALLPRSRRRFWHRYWQFWPRRRFWSMPNQSNMTWIQVGFFYFLLCFYANSWDMTDFKSKKIRVNLNLPIKAEVKAESADVLKAVDEDRKYVIQATIVR